MHRWEVLGSRHGEEEFERLEKFSQSTIKVENLEPKGKSVLQVSQNSKAKP
jgi:hypothetical protein